MELRHACAVLLLACLGSSVNGASILALFSSLSFADHSVFRGYVSLLTQQGHSVALMTPYPGQFQYPDVERIIEFDVGQESAPFWEEYKLLITNTDDHYKRLKALNEFSLKLAIAQLRSKQMTALFINPNIKFDLVITEADVPVLYAAAEKYGVPHITITTSSGKIHQHESKGNPVHPLLYPDVNTLNSGNLTWSQKVSEFYRLIETKNEYYNNYLPLCELAAKKIFGLKRSLQEVEYDIDLLLIAANPVLTGSRPVGPGTVFADRLQIKPGFTLPQELQTLLDSATKGAIYFSLGSIQDSEALSPHLLKTLTDAFKELPYTVLWKIGNATVIDKSDNVHALPWFPQQQVLAHPNVKAFITHGGARSLEEALFYQVPIVGLPLVQSRKTFISHITRHGGGEILDSYYLDKETVKKVVTKVVTDENYKKSISVLRHQVVDPLISGPEHALWWTQYVLRHGGAKHLRSPAVGVTFIQYSLLNLFIYITIGVALAIFVTVRLLRFISGRIRARLYGETTPKATRSGSKSGKFKAL